MSREWSPSGFRAAYFACKAAAKDGMTYQKLRSALLEKYVGVPHHSAICRWGDQGSKGPAPEWYGDLARLLGCRVSVLAPKSGSSKRRPTRNRP